MIVKNGYESVVILVIVETGYESIVKLVIVKGSLKMVMVSC